MILGNHRNTCLEIALFSLLLLDATLRAFLHLISKFFAIFEHIKNFRARLVFGKKSHIFNKTTKQTASLYFQIKPKPLLMKLLQFAGAEKDTFTMKEVNRLIAVNIGSENELGVYFLYTEQHAKLQ